MNNVVVASDSPEARKARIKRYTVVALIIGAAVISPVIYFAVKGLVGLAIAGVLGLAIVNLAPYVGMKLANWKVKLITKEAGENPIETLTNIILAKRQAFEVFKENVTQASTAEKTFAQKVEGFKKKWPARAPEFENQLHAMHTLVQKKYRALKDAEASLNDADIKLEEMKAYWEMSQAAQAANRAAGMDTGDLYEKLKADTAVDAVYSSMNRAFAELETAAALEGPGNVEVNPTAALEYIQANVIEVTPAHVTQKVAR